MLNWMARLLERYALPARRAATPRRVDPHVATVQHAAPPDDEAASVDLARNFLPWLLHSATPPERPLDAVERHTLERLDALLGGDSIAADLLPRAPSVVPQLLSLLRQENLSWHTMSQRIATDLVLSAEVLRQASNAAYASAHESSRPSNLDQALARLGSDDLRAVIARVVLRPLFANDAGLAAHSAVRAWEHAERQAQHGARIAASHGLDRLDAYLAALVHGGSWAMLLRAIDRILAMQTALPSAPAGPAFEWPFGLPFARQMLQRKDYLFGRVVAGWHLTPALTALGTEAAHAPLADTRSPLGPVLVQAEQRAAADAMALQRAAGAIHAAMASA